MEQAGYQTIREQVVPELATKKCPSPQLDLDAWCLELGERVVVDFTIRHPTAARYLGADAMTTACREKHRHYPAQAGDARLCSRHGGLRPLQQRVGWLARNARAARPTAGPRLRPPTRQMAKTLENTALTCCGQPCREGSTACPCHQAYRPVTGRLPSTFLSSCSDQSSHP